MEELIGIGLIGIVAIGAIVVGIPLLAVMAVFWWITIPIVCAIFGGWIGFLFGVGLDVVIAIVYFSFKEFMTPTPKAKPKSEPTPEDSQ